MNEDKTPSEVYINGDQSTIESLDSSEPLIEHAPPVIEPRNSIISDDDNDYEDAVMGSRWPRCCAISGLVVAVIGAVLAATFPLAYQSILNYELTLQPNTLQYHMWLEAPIPLYLQVYFFNVTNTEDVVRNKAKPILVEMGPYVFEEKHTRVNIKEFDNQTVQFQQRRTWHFAEQLSSGTLQDNITALNVPLMGAAYTLRFEPTFFKVGFNRIVKILGSKMFVTKTAGELLFDGYEDPLLDLAGQLPAGILPPFDKFAWFYQRNNSDFYDGVFNVFTGADDISKVGTMDMWNSTKHSGYYESHCGMINGTFGEAFAPNKNRSSVTMYLTDLCRSMTLDYEKDIENMGLLSYRYVASERVFANATDNADNWCFCSGGVCNPSGVSNSSTCRYGAPAFVSFPHFYLADPYYADQVEGLNPDKDLHQFHIDLEPIMGVPSQVRARLQVNILVEPDKDLDVVDDVERRFMPLIWFEVRADLTNDIAWWVNVALQMPVIGTASFFSLLAISLIVVAVSATILLRRRSRAHVMAPITGKF